MNKLHFWRSECGGCGDHLIAADLEDAKAVLMETVGDEEMVTDPDREWVQWPDEEPVNVVYIDEAGHPVETRTGGEIAATYGRGYWGGWA